MEVGVFLMCNYVNDTKLSVVLNLNEFGCSYTASCVYRPRESAPNSLGVIRGAYHFVALLPTNSVSLRIPCVKVKGFDKMTASIAKEGVLSAASAQLEQRIMDVYFNQNKNSMWLMLINIWMYTGRQQCNHVLSFKILVNSLQCIYLRDYVVIIQ